MTGDFINMKNMYKPKYRLMEILGFLNLFPFSMFFQLLLQLNA